MPADKTVQCRNCGESFVPLQGKPGYIALIGHYR